MSAEVQPRGFARVIAKRKPLIATAALAALAAGSVASMLAPRNYVTSARLDVEGVVGAESAARVAAVREQMLSSQTFTALSAEMGLPDAEARLQATEVVVSDAGGGRFSVHITHTSGDAETSFGVVRRLADRYQADVNDRPREEQETRVAEATAAEAAAAAAAAAARSVHAAFRAENADLLDGTEGRLARVREEMRALEETEIVRMKAELARLEQVLAEELPVRRNVRREVDSVRAADLAARVADAEAAAAAASEGSDDAKRAAAALALLREERAALDASAREVEEVVANPVHAQCLAEKAELVSAAGIAEIKLRELRKTERELQNRSRQAGPVRDRLAQLDREAAAAEAVAAERAEARSAAQARLDAIVSERGPVFTVAEPPVRPDAPAGPGPVAYALTALLAGAGIGLAVGRALDGADRSFRAVDEASEFLGIPALGAIPRIATPADVARERAANVRRTVGIAVLGTLALACAGLAVAGGDAVRAAVAGAL